jgi:hypothetical protein
MLIQSMRAKQLLVEVLKYSFLFLICGVIGVAHASAATYYVSPTGSDSNSGTSIASAWQSISKVNGIVFKAGDRVLFEGGKTFSGSIYFDVSDSGTASSPIEVSSYGTGRALISSGSSRGFFAYNTGGITLRNINFVGSGYPANAGAGVLFYNSLAGDVKLPVITMDSVQVSQYYEGIVVGGWNGASGYNGINITYSDVFNNIQNGIDIYGYYDEALPTNFAHKNLYIGHVKVYNNVGVASTSRPSGNGILFGQVDHGVVERSVVYNNGVNNTNNGGPVGIIAFDANDIVLQYNEAYNNHTSAADGGGFDFDGGVTNSTMQYNYSHDNDGAGYMFAQYVGAHTFSGNTIRYNVSHNDGFKTKTSPAGIVVWNGNAANGVGASVINNNTVYSDSPSSLVSAILIMGDQAVNLKIHNNIFFTKQNSAMVKVTGTTPNNLTLTFTKNDYWANGANPNIVWGPTSYSSVAAWSTATGKERLNGSSTALIVAPKLQNPGVGGVLGNIDLIESFRNYAITSSSPMINAGIPESQFALTAMPTKDFNGATVPQGGLPDIGASEFVGTQSTSSADTTAPAAPTNLTGTAVTTSRIDLAWTAATDNIGVVGYSVYRDTTRIATSTVTSYSDDGLATSSTHTYEVIAFDAAGNQSPKSTSVTVTTKAATTATTTATSTWSIGSGVVTTADTPVMSKPSVTSKKRGIQYAGARGTIIGGPRVVNGVTWWQINFATSIDGWVSAATLELSAVAYSVDEPGFFGTLTASVMNAWESIVSLFGW